MQKGYLVDIPEREQEAIKRLLELPFISEGFFGSLGLSPPFFWCLLKIRKDRFVASLSGDVDILAGRLIGADSGGIKWPPLTDYLVGIEAKCAYLYLKANEISADTIKSRKSSPQKVRRIRLQVEGLLQMGFNKVALLDIIANPPASGIDGQAWLIASNIAMTSMEEMLPVLKDRLPMRSPSGHWVWSIGSVIGGNETVRGTGAPICLRIADKNPFLQADSGTQSRRQKMESTLDLVFSKFPSPRSFPVIFIDCKFCGKIHMMEDACNSA